MNRRFLRRAQAVLGVTVLVVGIAVSPATAAEEPKQNGPGTAPAEPAPAGFRSWEELSEAQERLNNAADQILSAPSEGYSGTIAAPESGELQIYWRGEVPADAQERAARTGVPVKFLSARYSELELATEAERLGLDKRVSTAAPNVDGSGLAVTVSTDADRDAVLAEARLPLTVTVDRKPDLLFDRQNDISPYWGGARWNNLSTGSSCSTGFSVMWAGQPRMLTAAHCGNNGQVARIGNTSQPSTTIIADVNPRDTQMLNRPLNRTFAGRIYTGPWNSWSSIRVGGSTVDYVGNWICTGGAFSGEHCNAKVYAVNTSVLGIFPLIYAAKVPGTPAPGNCIAAPGDSGGPVYSHALYYNWPYLEIAAAARGTITAGYLDTPCISLGVWRTGSYRVFYAPVRRPLFSWPVGSLTFYGASLL